MSEPLSERQRAHLMAVLLTAARSTDSTVVAALTALEVAVTLAEFHTLTALRLANQRHASILDAMLFRGRARRQRDDINQLVDQTLKMRDPVALNALDYFILVARQMDG